MTHRNIHFFELSLVFVIAILRCKFPVVSGNFTSSDVNSPQGGRAQQLFASASGNFALSDVNRSPQGSRTQQILAESPGGTQRTGTIFLTPENGDADKQTRAKRQTKNSITRKRILQPDAHAAANVAKKRRFFIQD